MSIEPCIPALYRSYRAAASALRSALTVLLTCLLVLVAGGAAVAEVDAPSGVPRPLDQYFDNSGISSDSAPSAADLDGSGRSLSAQALDAAGWSPGQRLTLHRTELKWPQTRPGKPDNAVADGQPVSVTGRGDALTFLLAGTGGDAEGTGRVVYADGTESEYSLTAPDWDEGPLSTKAVDLAYSNSPDGPGSSKVRLYARTVPVDPDRDIAHVELPSVAGAARMHVFSLGLRDTARQWTGTWSASTSGYAETGPWEDQTLRLVVHTSVGGPTARARLDNTFAAEPVRIGRATVAVRGEGAGADTEPVPLTFSGRSEARIPAGGQAFSDPVGFDVPAGTDLLVSLYLPEPVTAALVHTAATGTNYSTEPGAGDHTADADAAAFTGTINTWPFLTGIDVLGGPGSVVTLGDSITDGVGSTPGANRRWPDVLANRLRDQSDVPHYGVLNQGISANQVVRDRYDGGGVSTDTGGVAALNRLDRDVFAQTNVRTVIVFQGINDVRWGTSSEEVIVGLSSIAEESRGYGLRVLGATIAPCEGWSDCDEQVDEERNRVNAFIRDNSGPGEHFDELLDFDAVLRDPDDPARLFPEYDSGDHLHPSDAGLRAAAESIDLETLAPQRAEVP